MPFDTSLYELSDEDRASLAHSAATIAALKEFRASTIRAAEYPGLASFALASLLQYAVYRIVYLIDGVIAEWNAQRPMNASMLLRSATETIASLHHALEIAEGRVAANSIRDAHDHLVKAMYGSRQMRLTQPEMPESTNVVTQINRLDKKFPGLRRYYDSLCEVTHPNADGMVVFGDVDHDTFTISFTETHSSETDFLIQQIIAGLAMLDVAGLCLQRARDLAIGLERLEKKHGPTPHDWPKSGA